MTTASKVLNLDELSEFSYYPFTKPFLSQVVFDVMLTSRPSIELSFLNNHIIWKFYGKRSAKRLRYRELETKNVTIPDSDSGAVKTLVFHVERSGTIIGFHDSIIDVILLAKHLLELFNASINILRIAPQHLDHLETILSIEKFKKAELLSIKPGTVSHEDMRRVLKDFDPVVLSVYCSTAPGFKLEEIISQCSTRDKQESYQRCSTINIENNTSWFKLPMLQTMFCREFCLVTQSIKNEELNHFLHLWCNDTNNNQMTIHISKMNCLYEYRDDEEESHLYDDSLKNNRENWNGEKLELQKIIQGLERFIVPNNNDDYDVVLQRETDGMMMGVEVITLDFSTNWHLKQYFKVD